MADTPLDLEVASKKSLLERLTLSHRSYSTGEPEGIHSDNGLDEEDSSHPMEVEGARVDSAMPSQPLTFASFKFSSSFSASSKDAPSLLQRMRIPSIIGPTVPPSPTTTADGLGEENMDEMGDSGMTPLADQQQSDLGLEPYPEGRVGMSLSSDCSAPDLLHRISPDAPGPIEPQSGKCEDFSVVYQPTRPDFNLNLPASQVASPSPTIVYDPPTQSRRGEASDPGVPPTSIEKEKSPECVMTPSPGDLSVAIESDNQRLEESTHNETSLVEEASTDLVRPNIFAPTFQQIISDLSPEKILAISASFEKPSPVICTSHGSSVEENEVAWRLETAFGPSVFEDLFTEVAIEQSEWNGLRSKGETTTAPQDAALGHGTSAAQSGDDVGSRLTVDTRDLPAERRATGASSDAESQQIADPNLGLTANSDHENLIADNPSVVEAQDIYSNNPPPPSPIPAPALTAASGHSSNHDGPLSSSRILAPPPRRESFIPLRPITLTALASLPPSKPLSRPSDEKYEWVSNLRPVILPEELVPPPKVVWPHLACRLSEFETEELSKAVTITPATMYGHNSLSSPGSGAPLAKRRKLFLSSRSPSSSPSLPPVKMEPQEDDALLNEARAVSLDLKIPTTSEGTCGARSGASQMHRKSGSPPAGPRVDQDYLDGLREAEALTNLLSTDPVGDRWVVIGSERSLGDEDAEGSTEEERDELAEDDANLIVPPIAPAQTIATLHSTGQPLSQDTDNPKPSQTAVDILTVAPLGPVSAASKAAVSIENITGSAPRVPITRKSDQEMSPHSASPLGSTLPSNRVEPLGSNRKRLWVSPDAANKKMKTHNSIELGDRQSSSHRDSMAQEDSFQPVPDNLLSGSRSNADLIALGPSGSSIQSRHEDEFLYGESAIRSSGKAYGDSYRPRVRVADTYRPHYPSDDLQPSQSGSSHRKSQPYRRSRSPRGESSRYVRRTASQSVEAPPCPRTPPRPRAPSPTRAARRHAAISRATGRGDSYVPSRYSYSPPRRRSPLTSSRSRNLLRTPPPRSQGTMNNARDSRSEESDHDTPRQSSSSLHHRRGHVRSGADELPRRDVSNSSNHHDDPLAPEVNRSSCSSTSLGDDDGIVSSNSPPRKPKFRDASPEITYKRDGPGSGLRVRPQTESRGLMGRGSAGPQPPSPSSATSDPERFTLRNGRLLTQVSSSTQMHREQFSPRPHDEVTPAPARLPALVERIQPAPNRASTSASGSPTLLDRMRQPMQSSPPPSSTQYQSNRSALAPANEPSLWQRMNDAPPPHHSGVSSSQALYDTHTGQRVDPSHNVIHHIESRSSPYQPQASNLMNRMGLSPPVIRARGRGRGKGTGRGGE